MTSSYRLIPALFVFLWATGFIGARYAMPWAEPFAFLAVRFVLAFAILGVVALARGSARLSPRDIGLAVVAGVLMHGIYLGGVFWAIRNGMPAGLSALIVGLQPLITAVLAGSLLGEKILPRHWAGLAAGFVGVAIVLEPRLGAIGAGVNWETLIASFVAVAAMSAGTVWQKRFLTGSDLLAGTCWQYAGGAALMIALSLAFETGEFVLTGELVFAMVWAVLVLSIGAIVLLMVMIRDGEISKVGSLFYLVPAVTALIAWVLFREQLNWIQIGGMALTTAGVALATARREPAAAA
ncbi:DMT family transporter [Mesorhizobium sp. VNQ89]|uniref:DMT family transporter n=1 Tax=Mesorhizobium quangtriensis TaxID=3157709 RepID=UPI0032B86765